MKQGLKHHDMLFVGMHCPVPELIRREAARGDRPPGSAEQDQRTIHKGRQYDLEVDATDGVDANVDAILAAWRSGTRKSEFVILRWAALILSRAAAPPGRRPEFQRWS